MAFGFNHLNRLFAHLPFATPKEQTPNRDQNNVPKEPDAAPQPLEVSMTTHDTHYPPPDSPLKAVTTTELVGLQAKLISQLRQAVSLSEDEQNRLLDPVINNLAAYVHLLPASQSHHHNGPGGLFFHSLETAIFAISIAKNRILEPNANPVDAYHNRSRWYLAIGIAALLHDVGKCATDMTISSPEGTQTWMPTTESLSNWLQRNSLSHYYCSWNLNRINQQHVCATAILYCLIVPVETRRFLEESYSTKLKNELYETLAGNARDECNMADIITKADMASCRKDLQRQLRDGLHPGVNTPIVIRLEKIMQTLVETQQWIPNKVGSPLWVCKEGIFLVWTRAISKLKETIQANGEDFQSLPRNPQIWFDKLAESSLVERKRVNETDGDHLEQGFTEAPLWNILPKLELKSSSQQGKPPIFLSALKLSDNSLLFSNVSCPAPTEIYFEGDDIASLGQNSTSRTPSPSNNFEKKAPIIPEDALYSPAQREAKDRTKRLAQERANHPSPNQTMAVKDKKVISVPVKKAKPEKKKVESITPNPDKTTDLVSILFWLSSQIKTQLVKEAMQSGHLKTTTEIEKLFQSKKDFELKYPHLFTATECLSVDQAVVKNIHYQDDRIYCDAEPIVQLLASKGANLMFFKETIFGNQIPPILKIDDQETQFYIDLK